MLSGLAGLHLTTEYLEFSACLATSHCPFSLLSSCPMGMDLSVTAGLSAFIFQTKGCHHDTTQENEHETFQL